MQQGMQQGNQLGKIQERKENIERMAEDGLSVEKIAQYVGESVETVRQWLSSSPVKAS